MAIIPWLLLGASLLLFAQATRVLATDARGGHYVTMGGAGLFSGHWLMASAAGAYRVIVTASLGRNAT